MRASSHRLLLLCFVVGCVPLQEGTLTDAAAAVNVDAPARCSAPAVLFEGHCYQAFAALAGSSVPTNYWTRAETECALRATGAHLVSVGSAAENAFVRAMLPTTTGGIMTGFSDSGRATNDFAWYDGSPVTYTNWGPGQPDNRTVLRFTSHLREDYAILDEMGLWFDVPYTDGSPFVCEFAP